MELLHAVDKARARVCVCTHVAKLSIRFMNAVDVDLIFALKFQAD